MPSLFVLHPLLTGVIFPCRYPYVSTRDCRGDLRGAVRHRARGYRGICFDYLTRQGGELVSLLYNFLLMPSCSSRTLLLDPIHLMLCSNHTAMIPTTQQNIVLLGYRCSAIA